MSGLDRVFNYCERGHDPSFWAEPINALSNVAFLIVAGAAAMPLARLRSDVPGRMATLWLLVALVGATGIGSFLLHTLATRWALIADVTPITAFMAVYLAFALRALLGFGRLATGLAVAAFLATLQLAATARCGSVAGNAVPCFNGSLGYVVALVLLVVVGLVARRRHAGARLLVPAACVFAAAIALRTIDREACALTLVLGQPRGTHALWHLLVAATVRLMLRAAIRGPGMRGPG